MTLWFICQCSNYLETLARALSYFFDHFPYVFYTPPFLHFPYCFSPASAQVLSPTIFLLTMHFSVVSNSVLISEIAHFCFSCHLIFLW